MELNKTALNLHKKLLGDMLPSAKANQYTCDTLNHRASSLVYLATCAVSIMYTLTRNRTINYAFIYRCITCIIIYTKHSHRRPWLGCVYHIKETITLKDKDITGVTNTSASSITLSDCIHKYLYTYNVYICIIKELTVQGTRENTFTVGPKLIAYHQISRFYYYFS